MGRGEPGENEEFSPLRFAKVDAICRCEGLGKASMRCVLAIQGFRRAAFMLSFSSQTILTLKASEKGARNTCLASLSTPSLISVCDCQAFPVCVGSQSIEHDLHVIVSIGCERDRKDKKNYAAKHSLHQFRKRRHIGPKCRGSPPPNRQAPVACIKYVCVI